MADEKKPSFFNKLLTASEVGLERFITKARSEIAEEEDDAMYRKSVYRDMSFQPGSQGWLERGTRVGFMHLRQMSMKDTIVAAIIQTRQNQISAFARPVSDPAITGFRVVRRKEEKALEEIMKELFGDQKLMIDDQPQNEEAPEYSVENDDQAPDDSEDGIQKSNDALDNSEEAKQVIDESPHTGELESEDVQDSIAQKQNLSERQKIRLAKAELRKRDADKIEAHTEFLINCGYLKDRPFESLRWDLNSWLRAQVRDRLTYDQHATETVNDQTGNIHHFVPADGSTIRLLSPEFSEYQHQDLTAGYDILYPEKELEALAQTDAFVPDPEKVREGDYKYAQVIRGRIERTFTPDELCVGMCNSTADIYSNGYSLSELELLIGTVTSHIFTENYNHSYFSDGFSAKGILHIKAPINRRKMETIRLQWKHMLSGPRNAFHTPIFSGVDDVQWIPLTQNHSDMEFSNWMNYLIKIICGIYQIDPIEIGFGIREEGGSGGLSGDNTEQKIEQGKDKGLRPMLIHFQNFINKHIMSRLDDDFEFEFCGLEKETPKEMADRQAAESKYKKTVNEIREENNLMPIPGADDLILDPTYLQWYGQFHPEGQKLTAKNIAMGQNGPQAGLPPEQQPEEEAPESEDSESENQPEEESNPELGKSFKARKTPVVIEYYLKD
jgi:hypothetical protein